MPRILSSDAAQTAITQMQAIINGGLAEQLQHLDQQGRILSDANVWDGPLAMQFRESTWPETRAALERARIGLDELRVQLASITDNIFAAGGAR